jgi:hypothetical protein
VQQFDGVISAVRAAARHVAFFSMANSARRGEVLAGVPLVAFAAVAVAFRVATRHSGSLRNEKQARVGHRLVAKVRISPFSPRRIGHWNKFP